MAPAAESSWRGRRVLVTGIGGFVGSALAAELLAREAEVVGILRDSPGARRLEVLQIANRITLVSGSITDHGLVERVLQEYEVDTVFHLAAQTLVGVANGYPISTFESNIAGTWHVLEAARRSEPVRAVVVASSDKAYGDQPELPYREDTPLAGAYPYDASKVCTDVLARCYATSFGLPVAVTRCANIYGPGDLNWSRLIPGTIRSALDGERPVIRSDGTAERDYLFLCDAVDGYLALAWALPAESGEAFNLGTERPTAVLEVVGRILALSGRDDLAPDVLGTATGEIDRQCLASDKARERLGWIPRVGLDEGLARSIDWYGAYVGLAAPPVLEGAAR
jgi:CDP-glucose 4,6-dehydratase